MPTTLTTTKTVLTVGFVKVAVTKVLIDEIAVEIKKMAKFNCKSAGDPFSNISNSLSLTSYKSTDPTRPRLTRNESWPLGSLGSSVIL